ncbi:MAG: hypothetical protein ACLPW4_19325 [Candidatus Sulfotelmatobacter sp.]
MSELFGAVEGEPVQVELSGVRVLFELLGFLLNGIVIAPRAAMLFLAGRAVSVYNGKGFNSLFMMRRTGWNARRARCGRVG